MPEHVWSGKCVTSTELVHLLMWFQCVVSSGEACAPLKFQYQPKNKSKLHASRN
jgi:hypothetical protein